MTDLNGIRRATFNSEKLVVLSLAAILLILLEIFDLTRQWNYTFYDFAIEAGAADAEHREDILLIAIDDTSITNVGAWPWDRSRHAQIVQQLATSQARSITLDVLFLEPTDADSDLAKALSLAQSSYLPLYVTSPGPNNSSYVESLPVSPLREVVDASGHVLVRPDSDGIVRRIDRYYALGENSWPHLGLEIAGTGQKTLTADRKLLAYSGGAAAFPTVSADALLRGEVPTDLIAGRDVIVGAFAAGLGDRYAVPFGSDLDPMAGAELLANVVIAERYGKWIIPLPLWLQLGVHLTALTIVWIAFAKLSARTSLIAMAAVLVGLTLGSWSALAIVNIWFAPMSGVIIILFMVPVLGWNRLSHIRAKLSDQINSLQMELRHDLYGIPEFSEPLDREIQALQSGILELRSLRSAMNDFLQAIPGPTVAAAKNGEILYYNRAALRQWQSYGLQSRPHTIEELFSTLRPIFTEIPEVLSSLSNKDISEQLSGMELHCKDGRHFLISTTKMSDSSTQGTILNFADVTLLMREVQSRKNVLEFLSHDLRAPVASALEWLNQIESKSHNPELRSAREATERALDLAASYVQLVKADHGVLAVEETDLEGVIDEAVDAVWLLAIEQNIHIEQTILPAPITLHIDRQALTRTLTNLLANAINHGSGEGDTVTIGCQMGADEGIVVEIGDRDIHSVGQIEDLLSSKDMYEYQAKGAGLGIAFAHTFTRKLGGSLEVTVVGDWKLFRLFIPNSNS